MLLRAILICFSFLNAAPSFAFGQQTQLLQHLWEVDPPLGDIWKSEQQSRQIHFDANSLTSRSVEDRLKIAQLICREHANPSFKQRELSIKLLIERLEAGEDNIHVRRAMFSAAVLVGDSSHAEVLWSLAKSDSAVATLVERALSRWKSPLANAVWRQRLGDVTVKPTDLAIALEGLAVTGNAEDNEALQNVIRANHTSGANKYLAAVALAMLVPEGLNEFAQQVIDSDLDQRYLIAAQVLCQHSGEKTAIQLGAILKDGPASAQLIAFGSMVDRMPDAAREFATQLVTHADNGLRTMVLKLLRNFADSDSLRLQSTLLSDRHPEVRRLAAMCLLEKAAQGHRSIVDESVLSHITSESWTGIEQAIVVAVGLRDRSYCKVFLRLLDHPRPEVNMHAGWALMEVADESEILASMLEYVKKMTDELTAKGLAPPLRHTDLIRLSYLHEAFGKNLYHPAAETLAKYIPKNGYRLGNISRSSAIWALGKLNKGKDDAELRSKLNDRIGDFTPVEPEDYLVRFACILALGEMAQPDSRDVIEMYLEPLPRPLGYAAQWALSQIDRASIQKTTE